MQKTLGALLRWAVAWLAGLVVLLVRWSCRIRYHNDHRAALRAAGHNYVYAVLHAHQIGAIVSREPGTHAMISRSADGDLLVPAARLQGIVVLRGSTRKAGREKGGREALQTLIQRAKEGWPTYFAVDGPRGPRNHVRRGIAELAIAAGIPVTAVCALPRRRWIVSRSWDRFQIPKPFTTVDCHFGDPLWPEPGDTPETLRQRIAHCLAGLEAEHDPVEAAISARAAARRRSASSPSPCLSAPTARRRRA